MADNAVIRKVGVEDLELGEGQITFKDVNGIDRQLTKINDEAIPVKGGLFNQINNVHSALITLKSNKEYLSDYANLQACIDAIGSRETTIVIDKNETLTADVTVPENIDLYFQKGYTISGAYTLTVNGGIIAGFYRIFGDDLTVNGNPKITEVYPEWFGASVEFDINNLTKDNTQAIQKAINTTARWMLTKLVFQRGIYNITNTLYGNYHSTLNPNYPNNRELQGRVGLYGILSATNYNVADNFSDVNTTLIYISTDNVAYAVVPSEDGRYQSQNLVLDNISFAGNTTKWIISLENVHKIKWIHNVFVVQYGTGNGFLLDTSWSTSIKNLYIRKDGNINTGVGFWFKQNGIAGGLNQFDHINVNDFDENIVIGTPDTETPKLMNNLLLISCEGRGGNKNFKFEQGLKAVKMINCHNENAGDIGIYIANNINNLSIDNLYTNSPFSNVDIMIGDTSKTGAYKGGVSIEIRNSFFNNVSNTAIKFNISQYLENVIIENNTFISSDETNANIYAIDGGNAVSRNFFIRNNYYKKFINPFKDVTFYKVINGYNSIREGRTLTFVRYHENIDIAGGVTTVDLSGYEGNFFVIKNSDTSQGEVLNILPPNLNELDDIPKTEIFARFLITQKVTLKATGGNIKLDKNKDIVVLSGKLPVLIDMVYLSDKNTWYQINALHQIKIDGTTSQRPSADEIYIGYMYFDTTLGKPIWWNGSAWVDATGTAV